MKAFPKVGLLVLVVVLATAVMATSAQAVTINPAGTAVSGTASNPTLTYGVASYTCNTATMDGNTSDPASDRISDLSLAFFGNCAVAGVGAATVTCEGTVTLIAQNSVTVRLNDMDEPVSGDPAFRCDWTTALCTITFQGPQDTANANVNLNETSNVLVANVNVQATRVGNPCSVGRRRVPPISR